MVNSERNKPFFSDIHGFEEAEETAEKLSKNISIHPLNGDIIKLNQNKLNDNNNDNNNNNNNNNSSLIRNEEKSYVDQNIVIIEKFYTELTPPNSRTKEEIFAFNNKNNNNNQKNKIFTTNNNDMKNFEIEFEKEKEKEIRKSLVQKCFLNRNIFLVAMEDYIKSVNLTKSSRVKTSTKITKNEIIDDITKLRTIVTTTEKVVTEMITLPTYVRIQDYIDNIEIDFSSFPATKVRFLFFFFFFFKWDSEWEVLHFTLIIDASILF